MTFLLILIFIFFILPAIVTSLLKYSLKRKIRNAYRQAQDQYNQYYGASAGQNEPEQPKAPAKKIAQDIGEYIHFEEIEVSSETTTRKDVSGQTETTTKIRIEEQVVDVEWEDID